MTILLSAEHVPHGCFAHPVLICQLGPENSRVGYSAEERERFDDTAKCILCAASTSACSIFWKDRQYFGPMAIVNAHRFIFDSRDNGAQVRLGIMNDKEGVWLCRTAFNCTEPQQGVTEVGEPTFDLLIQLE